MLILCVSVLQGAPTSTTHERRNTDLKRDIQLASDITVFTLTAINNTFNSYVSILKIDKYKSNKEYIMSSCL